MPVEPVVARLSIFPLVIPLREQLSDAMAQRGVSDPIVVLVELANGIVGIGETAARPSVTGETVPDVVDTLATTLLEDALAFHPQSFPEALEFIEGLPWRRADDRSIVAARAAMDLALLDASMRFFGRTVEDVVQWMGLPRFGSPGSLARIRFSGLLFDETPRETVRRLRSMYWRGLRHFKLKVGMPGDRKRLEQAHKYLRNAIRNNKASLRVDADGAWLKDEAIDWMATVADLGIASVEQPLPRGQEDELPVLFDLFDVPFVHDESLVTLDDAHRLVDLGVPGMFNIGVAKCGGLVPALRLAAFAQRSQIGIHLRCSVGETSILAAAGLAFLSVCPGVSACEGCFGDSMLSADIAVPSLRFGRGGRPPILAGEGLGVSVDPEGLVPLCEGEPVVLNL